MSRMNGFYDYPFPLPQKWAKPPTMGMDFLKFFFTSEYLRQTFVKFTQQLNYYS